MKLFLMHGNDCSLSSLLGELDSNSSFAEDLFRLEGKKEP